MKKPKVCIFLIDPQKDFIEDGAPLQVQGAKDGAIRLANMISKDTNGAQNIDDFRITADSHYRLHVAHKWMWRNKAGQHPEPFTTVITEEDMLNRTWYPVLEKWYQRRLEYLRALKANNRYELRIWPEHCIIGTPGWVMEDNIRKAVHEWEDSKMPAYAKIVTKGSNINCEHYSVVRADVPDPEDETTDTNTALIEDLIKFDIIGMPGWASSHCLLWSARDTAHNFGRDHSEKLVLLEDCTAPVGGYEQQAEEGIQDLIDNWGVKVATSEEFLKMIAV